MSCSRPSGDPARARHARGLSLIEVMISQSIAIIVISAMMAIVVAMVNKLQSEVASSDANVNLRQASHLLLRDTQGIGSSAGATAGDFIIIRDGGSSAADSFTIFRRDEAICGGSLPITGTTTEHLIVDNKAGPPSPGNPDGTCPFAEENKASCPADEVRDRELMVLGLDGRAVMISGHKPDGCTILYPGGTQATDVVAAYNALYDPDVSDVESLFPALNPIQVLSGSGFTYRLDEARSVLQRSTDFGRTFRDVLDGVFDLQVQRVYVNLDERCFRSEGEPLCPGFTDDDFVGLRIGLVTFARAADALTVPPIDSFGRFANRNLTSAPGGRRYRGTFILTAARNRSGA